MHAAMSDNGYYFQRDSSVETCVDFTVLWEAQVSGTIVEPTTLGVKGMYSICGIIMVLCIAVITVVFDMLVS